MKNNHVYLVLILFLAFIPLFSFQNCAPNKIAFTEASSKLTEASIRQFKPSLAVGDVSCLLCHASIKGNLVTELGLNTREDKKAHFYNFDGGAGHSDYLWGNFEAYGARNFLATTNINGEISLPYGELTAAAQAKAKELIGLYKTKKIADTEITQMVRKDELADDFIFNVNAPEAPVTIAQYLDTMLNYRTNGYMDAIKKIRVAQQFSPALTNVAVKTKINQISAVQISAAAASDIVEMLQGSSLVYIPSKTGARLAIVRNLVDKGGFYANADSQAIDCEGDIFTDKPLYLNNLIVQTETGCRIHSTRSIFVNASQPIGVRFLNKKAESNLQISSSQLISMGLGSCSSDAQGSFKSRGLMDNAEIKLDIQSLGSIEVKDAGNCEGRLISSRKVSFERLLVNAPQIQSRYTGNFKGIIISPFVLWSLGEFSFEYDTTFDQDAVQIFPRLKTPIFTAKE